MSEIPETEEAMPTKINLHAFQANLCLHEFFEPILLFDPHVRIVHGQKGKLKTNRIKTEETTRLSAYVHLMVLITTIDYWIDHYEQIKLLSFGNYM